MVQIILIIFGLVVSLVGLIYLLYPKDSFELSLFHSFLMLLAGSAWGVYTILGKNSTNAILHTADNFTKSLLYVIIFYIFFVNNSITFFLLPCFKILRSLSASLKYSSLSKLLYSSSKFSHVTSL